MAKIKKESGGKELKLKSVKEHFIKTFDKRTAELIEKCAEEHKSMLGSCKNRGSDPFKFALVIVIGFDCISKKRYFKCHGFNESIISPYRFERWCKEHGHLDTHDGYFDCLSLLAGKYNKFMPTKGVDLEPTP